MRMLVLLLLAGCGAEPDRYCTPGPGSSQCVDNSIYECPIEEGCLSANESGTQFCSPDYMVEIVRKYWPDEGSGVFTWEIYYGPCKTWAQPSGNETWGCGPGAEKMCLDSCCDKIICEDAEYSVELKEGLLHWGERVLVPCDSTTYLPLQPQP